MKASITYATTSEESAIAGDVESHGWWMPGGWEHALSDSEGYHEDVLDEAQSGEFDLELSDAINQAQGLGCSYVEINGKALSVSTQDADTSPHNGEETHYTLHISEVSEGSAQRIAKLFD